LSNDIDRFSEHLIKCGHNTYFCPNKAGEHIIKCGKRYTDEIDQTYVLLNKINMLEIQNNILAEYVKTNMIQEELYSITENFDLNQFEIDGRYVLFITNSTQVIEKGLYDVIMVGNGGTLECGKIKSLLLEINRQISIEIFISDGQYYYSSKNCSSLEACGDSVSVIFPPNNIVVAEGGKQQKIHNGDKIITEVDRIKNTVDISIIDDLKKIYPFIDYSILDQNMQNYMQNRKLSLLYIRLDYY